MSNIPRVLLAEESLPYRRVIREALTAFRHCEVDDTPSAEHAFQIALQRRHVLYILALTLPDMFQDHDTPDKQYEQAGLNAKDIVKTISGL